MPEPNIIEALGITKEFKGFVAVNNVSLRIKRNSIHGLIGPNGAGKTTCFNLLTRFLDCTKGRIRFDGREITDATPAEVARLGMVRSFQISATFDNLTVLENVRVALQRPLGNSYCFWRSETSLDSLNDRAMQLIRDVGLENYIALPAVQLPYGQKRALEIATTLALEPSLLLLDEPMSGMGREDVARTADLIQRVAADRTVLMVEHNLAVVARLSDTITVMARGEILAEGSYAEVSQNPAVMEAYIGTG